ncbi:MAG: hypothetical protein P1V35_05770, partial [Planctomycetota bacterium]|nr:hypothetical protein [Planctomycetota bacterium]
MMHKPNPRAIPSRLFLAIAALSALAVGYAVTPEPGEDAFRQLGQELPTPNSYRTASGAPGHEYWQQ